MALTLFYQNVTTLDYAYLDSQKGPAGYSFRVDMELQGRQDQDGILFDFSHAKKKVKEIIDQEADHCLIVPEKLVNKNQDRGEISLPLKAGGRISYQAPLSAFCLLANDYTVDNLRHHLEQKITEQLPDNVTSVRLIFHPEKEKDHAVYFQYTHGLKNHYGNCQRLIHGHRSTLKVWKNGKRQIALEKKLVQSVFKGSVHFVFWENVANKEQILSLLKDPKNPIGRFPRIPQVEIRYLGSQGDFSAVLPGDRAYFLPVESSVENLAIHFVQVARELLKAKEKDQVIVQAFEGIGKGAQSSPG